MKRLIFAALLLPSMVLAQEKGNPADNLPPHITRLTYFGERTDFRMMGRRSSSSKRPLGMFLRLKLPRRLFGR